MIFISLLVYSLGWSTMESLAEAPSPSTVLVYVEPIEFGSALAEVIEEETDFEVVVASDYRDLGVMLLMPQVRVLVFGPTLSILNEPDLYRKGLYGQIEWFYANGGGLIGLASAGFVSVTDDLAKNIFPLFGSYLALAQFDFDTLGYSLTYEALPPNPISSGVGDMCLMEQEYLVHINSSTLSRELVVPEDGSYTIIYQEPKCKMPLVVTYEKEGRSVTFAGLNLIGQEGPTYYGNVIKEDAFRKVFANALSWAADNPGYEKSAAKRNEYFADREARAQEVAAKAEGIAAKEKNRRAQANIRKILSVVGGIAAVIVIYKLTLK